MCSLDLVHAAWLTIEHHLLDDDPADHVPDRRRDNRYLLHQRTSHARRKRSWHILLFGSDHDQHSGRGFFGPDRSHEARLGVSHRALVPPDRRTRSDEVAERSRVVEEDVVSEQATPEWP